MFRGTLKYWNIDGFTKGQLLLKTCTFKFFFFLNIHVCDIMDILNYCSETHHKEAIIKGQLTSFLTRLEIKSCINVEGRDSSYRSHHLSINIKLPFSQPKPSELIFTSCHTPTECEMWVTISWLTFYMLIKSSTLLILPFSCVYIIYRQMMQVDKTSFGTMNSQKSRQLCCKRSHLFFVVVVCHFER